MSDRQFQRSASPVATLRAIDARTSPDLKWAVPSTLLAVLFFALGETQTWPGAGAPGAFDLFGARFGMPGGWARLILVGLALLFVIFGMIATRSTGRELDRVSRAKAGPQAGNAIRLIVLIVGYLIVILGALAVLRVNLGNLLVGGAVTGVVVGIAAQQTLGNFFAGLVLLFARPYVPGQRVKIRNGAMGGAIEGVIVGAGLMYTEIDTDEGMISLPNSALLASAIGPAPAPEAEPAVADPPDAATAPSIVGNSTAIGNPTTP